jgi:hypothetical protein
MLFDDLGNIVLLCSQGENLGDGDSLVLKFDPDGTQLWNKRLSDPADTGQLRQGVFDDTGDLHACGLYIDQETGELGWYIVRIKSDGSLMFCRRWDGDGFEQATGVAFDTMGRTVVVGTEPSAGAFGSARQDVILLTVDAAGALGPARVYTEPDTDLTAGEATLAASAFQVAATWTAGSDVQKGVFYIFEANLFAAAKAKFGGITIMDHTLVDPVAGFSAVGYAQKGIDYVPAPEVSSMDFGSDILSGITLTATPDVLEDLPAALADEPEAVLTDIPGDPDNVGEDRDIMTLRYTGP